MSRSPSRLKSKRAQLLDVDFSGPRERVLQAALVARTALSLDELCDMTLADRHWLIAQLMIGDGMREIELAEVCAHCGELLELRFDLQAAVRDAEPAMKQRVSGVRLPTARDLEQAQDAEALIAICAGDLDASAVSDVERILSDADPLGSIALNAACCQCGHQVRVEVDLPARWLAAQRRIGCDLLEEVHTLARHYHWSEREILSLSDSRRQHYIALCHAERRAEHDADSLEQQVYV